MGELVFSRRNKSGGRQIPISRANSTGGLKAILLLPTLLFLQDANGPFLLPLDKGRKVCYNDYIK